MASPSTPHAAPPDAAGNQGSFDRDDHSLVQASPNDLPGSTWESPRKGERPARVDIGLLVIFCLIIASAALAFAYCGLSA